MDNFIAPSGMEIIDYLEEPPSPPDWISEDELQYFAEKFQKNGFTGPLNYYRIIDTCVIILFTLFLIFSYNSQCFIVLVLHKLHAAQDIFSGHI